MALLNAAAPNFQAEEFARASVRPLSALEWERAESWALLLQPARDGIGRPVYVSSYVRDSGSGAHRYGEAIDVHAGDVAGTWDLFLWLADHYGPAQGRPARFGELIYERTHVHMTAPGVGGSGEILVEPREAEYARWNGARTIAAALGGGAVLLLLVIAAATLGR